MSDSFTDVVERHRARGTLVVQTRMGFGSAVRMRAGLEAVKAARGTTVGTITVDSFTRCGDHHRAADALRTGQELNGFPLVAHGPVGTRRVTAGVQDDDFPVQVRHGSARPSRLMAALARAGIDATEGGPVSYCLPYSRVPLREAVRDWECGVDTAVELTSGRLHIETFGGCMLGQLCPPGLLVALSVLEALFFRARGVRGISLSYAQQTNHQQDLEAVAALRRLADEHLPDTRRHLVLYTFMGMFPKTRHGAGRILAQSVRLAVESGAERLIVKTAAEAHRIPTVEENVSAVELAARLASRFEPKTACRDNEVYAEASALVNAVLELSPDVGQGLVLAVHKGLIDIPYCLHPDNAGRTGAVLDRDGRLRWADRGGTGSRQLIEMLAYNQRRFDGTGDNSRGFRTHR